MTMSFFNDKQAKRYAICIGICVGFYLLAAVLGGWLHGRETYRLLMERERTVASSLLEQGVSAEIIAVSLRNSEVTEAGDILIQKTGRDSGRSLWLVSPIRETTVRFGGTAAVLAAGIGLILLLSSILFLRRREACYRSAAGIITKYADGNFEEHLPGNETGTLFLLFAATEQLATALQAGREAEHRTKEFLKGTISDIFHQLKTPLAALTMYTEIILDEPDNEAVVREFSEKSMYSLDRIRQLIQALLKVTRLDAGSIVFEKRQVLLTELAARAEEELLVRAEREDKKIVLQGDAEETLYCDLEWTGEALGNLIKNALEHTPPGGTVLVSWERSPAMLCLSVSDDGPGIAPEDIHHIFKRFYRSKYSGDRQGVGLGLPLAKAIVEGQGGSLSVHSRTRGGSVFTISFLTDL